MLLCLKPRDKVAKQYVFFAEFAWKEFTSHQTKKLLLLSANMAAMTSAMNHNPRQK